MQFLDTEGSYQRFCNLLCSICYEFQDVDEQLLWKGLNECNLDSLNFFQSVSNIPWPFCMVLATFKILSFVSTHIICEVYANILSNYSQR